MATTKPRSIDDYMIGWICKLPRDWLAASAMLDETHPSIEKPSNDLNNYTMGSIYDHSIVIACPPDEEIGNNSAAAIVAARMKSTFPQIRFVLLVGVGSGIPPKASLGDVVVSAPVKQCPAVVQWDTGKIKGNSSLERIGSLNPLPQSLLEALYMTEAAHSWAGTEMYSYFKELQDKWPELVSKYLRSDSIEATLLLAKAGDCDVNKSTTGGQDDGEEEENRRCRGKAMDVKKRHTKGEVHFGLIVSGNQVIKATELSDKRNKRLCGDVLCVETEAAELAEIFPCLVIRGICDHADSHKIEDWQEHAAAMAAAFAKDLVRCLPEAVEQEPLAKNMVDKVLDTGSSARNESPQAIAANAERKLQRLGLTLALAQMLRDQQQNDKTQQLLSQKNTQLSEIKERQQKLDFKLRTLEILKSDLAKEEDKITGEIYKLRKTQAEAEQCTSTQTQLLELRQIDGLDHEYKPEEVDNSRLFRWAVEDGDAEIVQLFLDRGTDAMAAHKDGWMPLQAATSKGYDDVVRVLLKRGGVDADSKNDDGRTALQLDTERGQGDVMRPLLWKSANEVAALTQVRWERQGKDNVKLMAFSHDSRLLAAVTADRNIELWNTATGHCQETLEDPCQESARGCNRWITSMAFSHNSKLLASGSSDGFIKIWNTTTGECLETLQGHISTVNSVAFSHDSNLLASGFGNIIEIWNTATGLHQKTLKGHRFSINAVAFSNDPKLLASASGDRTVKLWNTTTGECQQTLEGHGREVYSVAFSHDSKLLASGSLDNTVKIWDTTTGECQQTLQGHGSAVSSVTFSHDPKILASGSDDCIVKIWDTTTGQCQETLEGYKHCVLSRAFPHGTKLAAASKNYETIKVWIVPIDILRVKMEET
ncbi:WD40-repeat-containing domain protein [Trichoderma sp. SZMC 28013]